MHLDAETLVHLNNELKRRYEGIKEVTIEGMPHRDYDVACGKAAGYKEMFTTIDEWLETLTHDGEPKEGKKKESPY